MTREELLKSLIRERYGSVLNFSRATGIPESSLRNIFSRGLDSISAGSLVTVCRHLGVDIEELMAGNLTERGGGDGSDGLPAAARPIDPGRCRLIPILGRISAGLPLCAQEQIEGYTMSDLMSGEGDYFALRVKGDSMSAAGIQDGYLLIVRRQDTVDDGDVAVVLVGDEDATVKRFYRSGAMVTLMPQSHNPIHQPQLYDIRKTPVRVLGKVVEVKFTL